jgi:CRP/FNR family transcriptional regulator, anaerobic regulatory protein
MQANLKEIFRGNMELEEIKLAKGEFFIEKSQKNSKFAIIIKGVTRGFIINEKGDEINILLSQEGDIISGNIVPNLPAAIYIQAIAPCTLLMGSFSELYVFFAKEPVWNLHYKTHFDKLHTKIQKRLISLISLTAIEKYQFFIEEYPTLLNRIPHYHVANFLGITPTQLSRIRKQFASISQQM